MKRGTYAQYTTEHNADCIANDIVAPGKVGYVDDAPAPNNQLTTAMYQPLQNPNGSDDYIWKYILTEAVALGWMEGAD